VAVDIWVSTSVHEGLIAGWLAASGIGERVTIRRAPGYRHHPTLLRGENPPLPAKIPTLIRLLPHLLTASVIVCAEQTSLWLPRILPFLPMRFIITAHGAGSINDRVDRRRDSAYLQLLPSEFEGAEMVRCGRDPARIERSALVGGDPKEAGPEYQGLGVTLFVLGAGGPDFDFTELRAWLAWRDQQNG